ncbi:MFS transporter [Granulosicoccus antarcticus]|uniref:Hexuronate transporter n=1 Tax=Granulosicoccus antarcticus IMCC3135 TaxID=1192854 RepID=A0A2Z2P1B6_9GAMM|nr:MFS transporter [Granulosicoccus antarcticus]ASJ73344.1 Hexuronate transporter [Granulosicoccus antarcticus IMCC3135]
MDQPQNQTSATPGTIDRLEECVPRRVHRAWTVALGAAIAIFCGLGLGRLAFGMLLPSMSASLGLDYGQGGLLGFANLLGYLIAVLLIPFILPLLKTRATTVASLLLVSLSMLAIALTKSFLILCLLFCFMGIGTGGVVLPTMSVMSQWFYPSHRGLAAGIAMAGPGFAVILVGFVTPQLQPFSGLESWQGGWLLFAVITVFVALLVHALIRNHPQDTGHRPYGRKPIVSSTTPQAVLSRSAKIRLLAHMGLIFAIYGATYMLYVTFIVTSMVDSYELSAATAGGIWAWFGLFSIFSGVLFGSISDRLGRRAGMVVSFAVLASAYLLVGMGGSMPGLYASIFLFGVAAWSVPVIMAASAGDIFGSAHAANALVALTLTFSTGQAMGPVLGGFLAQTSGDFSSGYMSSGALALLAIALVALLKLPTAAE